MVIACSVLLCPCFLPPLFSLFSLPSLLVCFPSRVPQRLGWQFLLSLRSEYSRRAALSQSMLSIRRMHSAERDCEQAVCEWRRTQQVRGRKRRKEGGEKTEEERGSSREAQGEWRESREAGGGQTEEREGRGGKAASDDEPEMHQASARIASARVASIGRCAPFVSALAPFV